MNRYVAILRGINVGGHKKIKMADLRDLLTKSGLDNVNTYIQSGNIVFDSEINDETKLKQLIYDSINDHYGFDVPTMVVSKQDFSKIFDENPFVKEFDSKRLCVSFLSNTPDPELISELDLLKSEKEQLKVIGKALYLQFGEKYSEVNITNGAIEKKLRVRATTRNWRTTTKLWEMVNS